MPCCTAGKKILEVLDAKEEEEEEEEEAANKGPEVRLLLYAECLRPRADSRTASRGGERGQCVHTA